VKHQIVSKSIALLRRKAFTLDSSLPASDLIQSLQKLTHIVYLTKLDADDKVKSAKLHDGGGGRISTAQRFCGKARSVELASTDQLEFTGSHRIEEIGLWCSAVDGPV
jgi:hypothetical protein